MLLSFKTAALGELCNSDTLLRKRFGQKGMKKIRQRLDELNAATDLAELATLPGPRCEELKGNRKGQLSVRAHEGMRIIFRPAEDPPPVKPDGGLDWKSVRSLLVLAIEDYHD